MLPLQLSHGEGELEQAGTYTTRWEGWCRKGGSGWMEVEQKGGVSPPKRRLQGTVIQLLLYLLPRTTADEGQSLLQPRGSVTGWKPQLQRRAGRRSRARKQVAVSSGHLRIPSAACRTARPSAGRAAPAARRVASFARASARPLPPLVLTAGARRLYPSGSVSSSGKRDGITHLPHTRVVKLN